MLEPIELVTKFSGPPGTGKSTTLLNAIDTYLAAGMAPEDILFTTFTRAGADEARNRACFRFNLPPSRFPYFRTLHSICFSLLPKREVMRWNDWADIGRILGVSFSTKISPDEPVPRGHTKGDYLLSLWSLSRVMRKSPEEVYRERYRWLMGYEEMQLREFLHFIESVQHYKQTIGRIDFTDMLEHYLAEGSPLRPRVAVIDEAQDLSLIQWEVAKKLSLGAERIIVAGDDDQCIHEWNGAFPSAFIELQSGHYEVLPQSYRIPSTVHRLAESVIAKVKTRLPKVYQPRSTEGRVSYADDVHQLDLSNGTWLLLARNITFLERYTGYCRERGYLWTSASVPCVPEATLSAIFAWKQLRESAISARQAQMIYAHMSSGDRITRGFKKRMEAAAKGPPMTFDHETLVKDWGLLMAKDQPWHTALDLIIPEDVMFLQAVERHRELSEAPRIDISTIHGAKGREADHVAIIPDMTFRTWEAYETNPDAEHRVWYVGVTRAKETLSILSPSTDRSYSL